VRKENIGKFQQAVLGVGWKAVAPVGFQADDVRAPQSRILMWGPGCKDLLEIQRHARRPFHWYIRTMKILQIGRRHEIVRQITAHPKHVDAVFSIDAREISQS